MNYQLDIRKHNIKPHVDIEDEIGVRRNGLLTFTLRVSGGNIMDNQFLETIDAATYLVLKKVEIHEVLINHG